MISITYLNRLIPQPLEASLDSGLSAEMRDPVWTLARQFQMGEFIGSDGGSPAYVDISTRTTDLTVPTNHWSPQRWGNP